MNASGSLSMLPAMSTEEEAHSRAVSRFIGERIEAAGGWLPFDEFMELALYAPGLGYYTAGGVKIGSGGDFTTAPEVSDLFSRCVARQASEVLGRTGGSVLELGAGTGRMAASVMTTLASLGALPEQYAILEVSADLRERQRARIEQLPAELRERVVWLDALPSKPIRGVILANEVLDALPCQRVVIRGDDVRELGVSTEAPRSDNAREPGAAIGTLRERDAGALDVDIEAATATGARSADAHSDVRFVEREAPARADVAAAWRAVRAGLGFELIEGYRTELCTRIEPWIAGLSESLETGLMLLFDYGLPRAHYYHPQRTDGTLRCHFRQRAHNDPFINVGVQDITAWVDFTRVAEAADRARLDVSGFATQAAFLLGLGIESLISDVRLASEARKLLMPGEMGEAFKAMALTRAIDFPLSGFSVQDLRHSL
jgi:SAM-dependent MidA family methyltransferase